MRLLQELIYLVEADDMTELPADVYHSLEQHILKGAQDTDKKVVNALELVKEAYKVENVELPNPSMKKGWEQFSKLIEYAAGKLLKFRGINGDWRMTSNMFHESINSQTFSFTMVVQDSEESGTVEAETIDEVIQSLTERVGGDHGMETRITENGDSISVNFYIMNVKQPMSLRISSS